MGYLNVSRFNTVLQCTGELFARIFLYDRRDNKIFIPLVDVSGAPARPGILFYPQAPTLAASRGPNG
jgi:hypothetical protein